MAAVPADLRAQESSMPGTPGTPLRSSISLLSGSALTKVLSISNNHGWITPCYVLYSDKKKIIEHLLWARYFSG